MSLPVLTDSDANGTGTAGWFRILPDSESEAYIDGTCGESGADMNFDNATILEHATVTISLFTIEVPE